MFVKNMIFKILTVFFLFTGNLLYGQNIPGIDVLYDELSTNGTQKVENAEVLLSKAETIMKKVEKEDEALAPIFKKKKRKGEKKSINAKALRIKAAAEYQKAFTGVYEAYREVVAAMEFKINATEIIEDANVNVVKAQKILKKYQAIKKSKLKKQAYDNLKRDLDGSVDLIKGSMNEMVKLFNIWKAEKEKAAENEADNQAWQYTTELDSKYSYQSYLDEYPSGLHSADARSKIDEFEEAEFQAKLEEEAAKKRSFEEVNTDLVYHVQIRAAKKKIPQAELKRLYKKNDIKEVYYKGWYKYLVGEENSYENAEILKKNLKIRNAFIIALYKDTPIDIKKAINIEEGK